MRRSSKTALSRPATVRLMLNRSGICIRSGKHSYNAALIASLLAHRGPKQTAGFRAAAFRPSVGGYWNATTRNLPNKKTGPSRTG